MESAIFHRYCPLPGVPLHLSYGSKVSQKPSPKNFHLRFNHATPLCLPHFSTTRRPFRHANCMLERFSVPPKNDGSDNRILRGVTGVSVVLACVLGLFNFSSMMNPKLSTASGFPFGDMGTGKEALRSMFELINAECTTDVNKPIRSDAQVKKLKFCAIDRSNSRTRKEAENILVKQYNDWKKQRKKDEAPGAEERSLGVALVEMFMFQENFKGARQLLDEQIDQFVKQLDQQHPSNGETKKRWERLLEHYKETDRIYDKREIARFLLYKAIVHAMLKDKKEATEWWEAFMETFD